MPLNEPSHDGADAERRTVCPAGGKGTALATEARAFAPPANPGSVGTRCAGREYPWPWSVYRWISGETASQQRVADLTRFAVELAQFLTALQRIEVIGGPPPGLHNFFRGGALATYDEETRRAIAMLAQELDTAAVTRIWDAALSTTWSRAPVWVHGDVAAGNLLVDKGQLSAVIDFGSAAWVTRRAT